MPIQISKGCYWGKCLFCGLHYSKKKYSIMDTKKVVNQLEILNKENGIKFFEFVDEAIPPQYLSDLAEEIIKRKLDIKYCICSRIENNYTDELCIKLYKSGLRLVELGYESANKNVYKKLNKGIDFHKRHKIIKMFANHDIWTYCYAIVGYPFEKKTEALETLNLYKNNQNIIDTLFVHKFWLDKKSPIIKDYKRASIEKIYYDDKNNLSQKLEFKAKNQKAQQEILDLFNMNINENPLAFYPAFAPDEYFFLYVFHYGRRKLKQILLENNKSINK